MAGVTGYLDSNQARKTAPLANAGWVDSHERQMLAAAQLALNLHIPTEESGISLLPLVNRHETEGWKLYEDAVAGFYQVVLSERGWRVRPQSQISWQLADPTPRLRALMPGMKRDVTLEGENRRIIIDTKFTSIISSGQHGSQSFRSQHIYQLYAYLRSQETDDPRVSEFNRRPALPVPGRWITTNRQPYRATGSVSPPLTSPPKLKRSASNCCGSLKTGRLTSAN